MNDWRYMGFAAGIILTALASAACSGPARTSLVSISPANLTRVGTVDQRFQSYNVEMVEVTGGRFWKPYRNQGNAAVGEQTPPGQSGSSPVGMDPTIYRYRPPIDLSDPRLRKLAAALGPAYVRVSGTWANTTYFQNSNAAAPETPPKGFNGTLTRKEWKGVVDFSDAVDAKIVTSFATSSGTRSPSGVWTPKQARELLTYTKSIGGSIAAAEFMNEPTYAEMGGAPKGYDAAAYGRDVAVFHTFAKQAAPHMIFLGPGSVGEGGALAIPISGMLKSEDLLRATGPAFDVFSYHFYGAASQRCASMGSAAQTTAADALSKDWLSRADTVHSFYAGLRDQFDPGKPMWITEMADAACGGNPWASTFLDTFRYLDQHASLAQRGVKVIFHNTLASSDYGLLDENSFAPRPNYWASILWNRLMGTTVLDVQVSATPNTYVYAQCLEGRRGGVTLLVINADQQRSFDLNVPTGSERYTLSAKRLEDSTVELNGNALRLTSSGDLPQLTGEPVNAGRVSFAPASITFLAIANAGNANCQ